MNSTPSNRELAEFIRSEMSDDIVFQDHLGRASKISYKDFFTGLCERKTLVPHLELVSCVTLVDEFYPIVYDCFTEDYGHVDFNIHPESLKKFSPVLFTLCLDFISNKGTIINREYSKQGKDIAYLEKLLHSEIHYTRLESSKGESVYYKDFLEGIMKSGEIDSALEVLILEAQAILLSHSQKVEVSEDVMLMFFTIFEGIVSPPLKIGKAMHSTYIEDLQFMLSSVGIYTCVNHINKVGDISVLLPVLYTQSASQNTDNREKKNSKKTLIIVLFTVVTIFAIIGLVKGFD